MKERKKRKRQKDRKKERNKVRKKERRNSMKKDKEIKKERKKKTESFDLFTCDSPICSINYAYTNRLIYALLIACIYLFLAAYLAESSKTYRKDILEQRISRIVHALLQSGPDPSWSHMHSSGSIRRQTEFEMRIPKLSWKSDFQSCHKVLELETTSFFYSRHKKGL